MADNISQKYKNAGLESLPSHIQNAVQGNYLELQPVNARPVVFSKIYGIKNRATTSSIGDTVVSNGALRDEVVNMFFKNSNSFNEIRNITNSANSIAFKHYTNYGVESNIGLSLHSLNKFKDMVAFGKGDIISLDTETLGTKGIESFSGITEVAYYKRSAETIKQNRELKSLFEGAHDGANARNSFLFGLTDEEARSIMGKVNSIREGNAISNDDRITLSRLAMYDDANIEWDNNKNRFMLRELGEGAGEFADNHTVASKVESAVAKLTGRASGYERMAEQTIRGQKAHNFLFDMMRELNHDDNLVSIYNHKFDKPVIDNLMRIASSHMSPQMQLGLSTIGGEINQANIIDPLEIFNASYGENISGLYNDVLGVFPNEMSRSARLETIIPALYEKVGVQTGIHHQAEQDALDALNLLSYRDDSGNLIFGTLDQKIKDNLKSMVSEDGVLNPDGQMLNKGDMLYFLDGVQRHELDSFTYNNPLLNSVVEDKYKVNTRNAIGAKEVFKFDGMYQSNFNEMKKHLSADQQKALLQSINSGAMKNDFMVGVLKNAYNQNVMLYGKNEWDISRRLQSGLIVGHAGGNSPFFTRDSMSIDKAAMGALGASENDIRLRTQGLIGDIDKAQKRYRGWFDVSEGSRSFEQAKKFYSEAQRLSQAGISKEEFFNIAFNGDTIKGVSAESVFKNISTHVYKGETKYSSSAMRDLYHMYDRLSAEANTMLPIFDKIHSQFGDTTSLSSKTKAKAIMSEVYNKYSSILEENGVSQTSSISKLGYEKNAIVIPRTLFGTHDYATSMDMIRNGEALEDIGIELNVTNTKSAALRVNNMIKNAAKVQGAEFDQTFYANSVNNLIAHAVDNGLVSEEQANIILKTQSASSYVKTQDLMSAIKKNNTYHETIRPEFDLMDFSGAKANQISQAISQNREGLLTATDDIMTDVIANLHVADPYTSSMKEEFEKQIKQSSFISDIAKSSPVGELGEILYDSQGASEQVASELAESLSKIANNVVNEGKDFAFSIIKEQGEKYNNYYLAMGLAEDVASGKVLGKQKSNVALIELGSQTSYQGVPVITMGGYRQIPGKHIDMYDIITGRVPGKEGMKVYDSYAYAMKQMGVAHKTISEALINKDYQRASSRATNQLHGVVQKLTRSTFDLYDKDATARANDLLYTTKMYSDTFQVFGDKHFDKLREMSPSEATIENMFNMLDERLRTYGSDRYSAAKKISENVKALNSQNMSQALKIMLGDANGRKVDPIAREVAKFAKATGVPEEHITSLFYAVHEGDANKALSGWGINPSYFHDYGYMYSNKRPVGRQNLTGRTFYVEEAKKLLSKDSGLEVGTAITTRTSNMFRDLLSRNSKSAVSNVLTGNVLLMSQGQFDNAMKAIRDTVVNNPNATAQEKVTAQAMYEKFQKLNITNQESIISHEVGSILADKDIASYNSKHMNLTKNLHEAFKDSGSVFVKKDQIIGYKNTEQGMGDAVRAKATGQLVKAEDGRFILKADNLTNQTMKVGISGTEKSVGTIISREDTNFLRKYLGDFGIIGNFEVGNHEGFNTLYHDLFTKKFEDIRGSGIVDKDAAYRKLQGDMAYALTGDRNNADKFAKIVRDKNGNVTSVEALSYDAYSKAYSGSAKYGEKLTPDMINDRISKERINWLEDIQKEYAKTNPDRYDIKKSISIGGRNIEAYNLRSSIYGMAIVDDIAKDKGVKFDIRGYESMLRARDANGNPIMQPFLEQIYKIDKNGEFRGKLLANGELERLNKAKYDVDNMSKFLAIYDGKDPSKVGLGNVKELNSALEVPFYKNTMGKGMHVTYEDIKSHMDGGKSLFGEGNDFVKLNLQRDIRLKNGDKIRELYLPNVTMSGLGDKTFASTRYQRQMKNLINATVDLKASHLSTDVSGLKHKNVEKNYENAVLGMFDAIKEDFGSKRGRMADLFHVRLKNSGIAENKELFQANEVFTAGKEGLDDIVYISEDYAKRLLGDEYHSVSRTMKKSEVMKQLGKNASFGQIEDAWGSYGIALRYPTILESSEKVVKYRIAEGDLGGRQAAIFRHTSFGNKADVDGDQLGIVLLNKNNIEGKAAYDSLAARYEHQKRQNIVAQKLSASEYNTVYGFSKDSNKVSNFGEVMNQFRGANPANGKLPFVNKQDTKSVEGILEAFRSKEAVGKANIPSFYLRQYANNARNNNLISEKQLKLISAFSETAEQKMIDAIKKDSASNPIDIYFNAMRNQDSDALEGLVNRYQKDFAGDTVKRFAYHTGDVSLAESILAKDERTINNVYKDLAGTIRTVMKDTGYKPRGLELGISNNPSHEALRQAIENDVVTVKNSAQDIMARNTGFNTKYQDINIMRESILNDLKNSHNSDIIKEDVESISTHFRQAMNEAGSKTRSTIGKAAEFLKSGSAKKIGLTLAAMSIGAMTLGAITKPAVKTRSNDDVGLADEGSSPMPAMIPSFSRVAPITMNTGNKLNGGGMQININATNAGGLSDADIHGLLRSSFGGQMNMKVDFSDDRQKVTPNYINNVMMNSLNY